MGIPHITSFCWCMGLEMGSKFIGIMHLAASTVLMVTSAVFASHAAPYVGSVADAERVYSAVHTLGVAGAVLSAAHALLATTLLISAYKRHTSGLRVWVWAMSLLFTAALIYLVVETAITGFADSGSDIFLSFLGGLVFYGVVAYCILCVNSFYLLLKSSEDMEGPNKTYYN